MRKEREMRKGGLVEICKDRSELSYHEGNYRKADNYSFLSVIFENAENPENPDIYWNRDANGIKKEVIICDNNKILGLYKLGTDFLDPVPFLLGLNILCPESVHPLICADLNSARINNIDDLLINLQ